MVRTTAAMTLVAGLLAAGLGSTAWAEEAPKPSGTVTISQTQVAFIGSASMGGGTLRFRGKKYPFKIGGLGIGGTGASKIEARGQVYNLNTAGDFEGVYGQARLGWAVGNKGGGQTWLQNEKGVVLKLTTRRQGLMLAGGADAVRITFR